MKSVRPSCPMLKRYEDEYLCLIWRDAEKWRVKEANIFFEKMSSSGVELFENSVIVKAKKGLFSRSRSLRD